MAYNRPEPLSGKYEGSYAYLTIRDRMPVILTKVIDGIHRKATAYTKENNKEYAEDAKGLVSKLSELNYKMKTNKPLTNIEDKKNDVKLWNDILESVKVDGNDLAWYNGAWLTCETYLYRKIYEAFALSNYHQDCDPFKDQKQASFILQKENITSLANILLSGIGLLTKNSGSDDQTYSLFETLLQFSLWGNKFDLSVFSGEILAQHSQLASRLQNMKSKILANDTPKAWAALESQGNPRIDFILDNAGLELFTDLCLAEFLLNSTNTSVVHLHIKDIPWFVSDTTEADINWTLKQLQDSDIDFLSQLGHRWSKRISNGSFVVRKHLFWTLCHDFSQMKSVANDLYNDLSKSKFLFFKGDLNYRKLVGDLNWPYTTPFSVALCGFSPAPLCALRTVKAEVVVGLEEGRAEQAQSADTDWMISGDYAVIQTSFYTNGQ
ncbi:protein-glutamate O-methyltransferase [Exaiptasia diaphana]|uniref:Sugar phosphate phosphatase n=1 Tax=Exaiptasia diaphana TaxID=2652724 RepID=A0A913XJ47_EXADI|nr:protein-glutamate O-methyltransferase [Exaiptasia diaphana]